MQLYSSPTTPFGRKVMVLILESDFQNKVEVLSVAGTPLDPGTMPLDQNPLGKIPALIPNPGAPAIYDSRVICRYIDSVARAGLYPNDDSLWPVLTLEATADGILDASVSMVYEVRLRPEGMRYEPMLEAQWSKIARALDAIEARWMTLLDGKLTMAHLGVGVCLGYLDFRLGDRNWRKGRPRLATWNETFAERPSMVQTRPA